MLLFFEVRNLLMTLFINRNLFFLLHGILSTHSFFIDTFLLLLFLILDLFVYIKLLVKLSNLFKYALLGYKLLKLFNYLLAETWTLDWRVILYMFAEGSRRDQDWRRGPAPSAAAARGVSVSRARGCTAGDPHAECLLVEQPAAARALTPRSLHHGEKSTLVPAPWSCISNTLTWLLKKIKEHFYLSTISCLA